MAAGLAGGSSDGAATLEGLNRLWRLGLTAAELATLGAGLGSDIPFFFSAPAAWCTGRGEKVTRLPLGRPLWFVLVCPPVGLSTATVYGGVTVPEQPESGEAIRQAVADGDVEAIGRRLHNRLQPVAERLCPEVAALHARLGRLDPAGHAMSGSGTSLFALCRDDREALRLARQLRTGRDEGGREATNAGGVCPPGTQSFVVRSCL
jgi:4-diphosphocytidyl-2-C-methyl-D-erythritol kinase